MKRLDESADLMAKMEALRDGFPWLVRSFEFALYIPFLYSQRVKGFTIPIHPHFDEESSKYFVPRLKAARSYLEFGSGGSTLLAVEEGISVTTVDSDPHFLAAVERAVPRASTTRRRLIYADIGLTQAWGIPVFRRSTPGRLERWRSYCTSPWRDWPSEVSSPDLILVDGRFRVACALATIRELSLRGSSDWEMLVDDYGGRWFYREIEQFARLVRMVGRMAVFAPRGALNRELLNERIDHYSVDWR